jgi:Arc/MetJ-type ribon-helix-helix transcriptional regulator
MQVMQENEHVSTRLSHKEIEKIDSLVASGMFLNRADFLRTAARRTIEGLEIMDITEVSVDEAKKEILAHLKKHRTAYPSDVADALHMDMRVVVQAVKELWESKEIEEAI